MVCAQVTGWTVFTDIMGLEDHHGDMDFKIAGTSDGITAVQLDIKPAGVPLACLLEALKPSKVARYAQLCTSFRRGYKSGGAVSRRR